MGPTFWVRNGWTDVPESLCSPLEMLDIYEKVLGLKFVKVPSSKAVVWHPDVQLYECWDNAEDKHFSGYMYLDLFPRDSKCKSTARLGYVCNDTI